MTADNGLTRPSRSRRQPTFTRHGQRRRQHTRLEFNMTTETISEHNKKTVLAFYKEAHFDGDVDGAIARYVGDTYIQHTPAALAMFDRDMRYIAVSRRWCDDFNLRGSDILGRSHYEIFPDMPPRWLTIHRRALGGATIKRDEDTFERSAGSVQYLRWEVPP